jgi:predicted nucleic acid-binding protein
LPQNALDEGEVEALALAHQLGADLILLDEPAARRRAEDLGFRRRARSGVFFETNGRN